MIRRYCLIACLFPGLLAAQEFVSPEVCAECHASQYKRQIGSRHAHALRPASQTELPALLSTRPFVDRSGFSYSYERVGDAFTVTVARANERIPAVIEWAFGAGAQGITPVGRIDGRYFEHRLSWYMGPQRPAITFGHPRDAPTVRSALGMVQDSETIFRCFNGHATGGRKAATCPDPSRTRPGVTCERCHVAGAGHVAAARSRRPDAEVIRSILNPGRFSPKAVIEICGECHRLPQPDQDSLEPEVEDPVTVRFQPVGLLASRCFIGSGRLSCLTCHDPHDDARPRNSGFYDAKCVACHDVPAARRTTCPRPSRHDCVTCHMPLASPAPHLRFTDHRIRVQAEPKK